MLMWDDVPFTVFDTETTGFGSDDRIVEISVSVYQGQNLLDSLSTLVNPGRPIPEDSSAVHRIYDADVTDAPRWEQIQDRVLKFFDTDRPIVAHGIAFDTRMLRQECGDALRLSPFTFCTMEYAKRKHPVLSLRKKGHRLEDLAVFFDIPFDANAAHGADYDVAILAAVTIAMMKDIPVQRVIPGFVG